MMHRDCDVEDILDFLGDFEGKTKVRIKCTDGSIKEIGRISFRNIICDGDDIIYLHEEDPLWTRYGNQLRIFLKHSFPMAQNCDQIIRSRYETTDFALDNIMNIAHEVDDWLAVLKIKHDFEPGTGPDNEIFCKFKLLKKWYNSYDERDSDKFCL